MRKYLLVHLLTFSLVLLLPASTIADVLTSLGKFGNVISSDDGDHCGGYSLSLWKHKGSVIGLFDSHEGTCGDPPCSPIRSVRHSSTDGMFSFTAEIQREKFAFTGTLASDSVAGSLNGVKIAFIRSPDLVGPTNLAEWCKFWKSVARCGDIESYCKEQIGG